MKVPVAHFLIAPVTKGKGVFSPFLHFYFQKSEAARIAEAQAELKPRICEMVQSIGLKAKMKAPAYFWQGALNLLRYWQDIPETFLDTDNKKLLLGKASSLFTAVSAYHFHARVSDISTGIRRPNHNAEHRVPYDRC